MKPIPLVVMATSSIAGSYLTAIKSILYHLLKVKLADLVVAPMPRHARRENKFRYGWDYPELPLFFAIDFGH